jgi:hypothetical protein
MECFRKHKHLVQIKMIGYNPNTNTKPHIKNDIFTISLGWLGRFTFSPKLSSREVNEGNEGLKR